MKLFLRAVLVVTACLFAGTTHAQGFLQGLNKDKIKETLQNVVENVASDHIRFNITGEWIYKGATVNLKSSNQLANIGSQVLGNTLDAKINEQLAKIGVKPDMMRMTFNADSTFQAKTNLREVKGTYSYNSSSQELTLVIAKTVPVKIGVEVKATNIEFLFDADGLLTILKKIGSTVQIKALEGLTALLNNYDDMQVGLKFNAADGRKLEDMIGK